MKVLTAAEMREVDRRTIELGIPGIVLMENAGASRGGGDGGAVRPARLAAHRGALRKGQQRRRWAGDRAAVAHALSARGARRGAARGARRISRATRRRTTACCWRAAARFTRDSGAGALGDAGSGRAARDGIAARRQDACWRAFARSTAGSRWRKSSRSISRRACRAIRATPVGELARADCTVTFTAPKIAHAMPPNCDHMGELVVGAIGSPAELYEHVLAVAGRAVDVRRAAGAAAAWRTQGDVRARAGDRRVAGEDRRGGDGGDRGAAGRARGW